MPVTQTTKRGPSLRRMLPEATFHGARDIAVASYSSDSRRVQPGDLFVAIMGTRTDGHDHVREAIKRGASAVLCERQLPIGPVPCVVVPDSRVAYGRMCQAVAGNPSKKLRVIGVTGTNGKTTTSCLIGGVLQAAGCQPGLIGTLGYCDGRDIQPAEWTTPPADVLAGCLSRMVDNGCTHAVMEVSSHALSQARVAGVDFDAACFTNVGRDHLDYHNSLQNYRGAKARLLKQLTPEGFAIINADDPVCVDYLNLVTGPALTVGIHGAAEITATPIERHKSEQTFLLHAGQDTVPVRTQMIGEHHISNCLVAAAVGLVYGIDLATVVRGLESIGQVPGRLERIECGQPFGVYVDYAHTPDALAAALRAMRSVTPGKVICVFGAGGQRDRKKRPLMSSVVAKMADVAVVTTDNPRGEDPDRIIDELVAGFGRQADYRVLPDRSEAIHWALENATADDCVLIAGKGHEDYQIIGRQKHWCDDRELARQWLRKNVRTVTSKFCLQSSN